MYNPETETFELKKDKSDMIPIKSNEIPDDLKKSLKDNKCVLFVGSGLSVSSNFPNWSDLMKRMVENLTPRNTRSELLTKLENLLSQNTPEAFLEIATEFRKQENTTSEQYFNFMNEVFNPLTLQLSPNHFLLKKISLRAMITTNYDYLLCRNKRDGSI